MKTSSIAVAAGLCAAGLIGLAAPASAVSLGAFTCITNNSAGDCDIAETQLSADLSGNILTITMTGTAYAVVEQVFIEGGVTGGTYQGGVGSDFGDAQNGGNLPGGNNVGFVSAINFAADNPAPRDGVGAHNQDPDSGQTAIFELIGDLSDLRIGVHVIGYASGGSESLVNGNGTQPVPEPSAALVFALGLGIAGVRTRRR